MMHRPGSVLNLRARTYGREVMENIGRGVSRTRARGSVGGCALESRRNVTHRHATAQTLSKRLREREAARSALPSRSAVAAAATTAAAQLAATPAAAAAAAAAAAFAAPLWRTPDDALGHKETKECSRSQTCVWVDVVSEVTRGCRQRQRWCGRHASAATSEGGGGRRPAGALSDACTCPCTWTCTVSTCACACDMCACFLCLLPPPPGSTSLFWGCSLAD